MADTTRIDPEQARQDNQRLRQLGSQFGDAVARMQSTADQYNGCWGDDQFGHAFAKGYVPSATETLKNIGAFGQNVTGAADQIDQAINDFESVDKNNASNVH